ncbi:hypothetical protein TFLX_01014 [Thermoflexales bacterium]|nr:hypothetical protein TFLX_01014 [Thermoflexales bacterium]
MDQVSQTVLIGLVAVVVGWFAFGNIYNIRHGNAVLRWMQGGLPRLGSKTTVQWRGTSVAQLNIAQAKAPFKSAELLLVLEPRDIPWYWLMTRNQRRRDMLIIRGWLSTTLPVDYDLYAPGSWSEQLTSGRGETQNWKTETLDGLNLRASLSYQSAAREQATRALSAARSVDAKIWRLSCRRSEQNLELHVPLPNPRTANAEHFFKAVQTLVEQMSKH